MFNEDYVDSAAVSDVMAN